MRQTNFTNTDCKRLTFSPATICRSVDNYVYIDISFPLWYYYHMMKIERGNEVIYYLIGWVVLGLIGQAIFMFLMKREYPDYLKDDEDWDIVAPQVFMSMLGGPVTLLVLLVIFGE